MTENADQDMVIRRAEKPDLPALLALYRHLNPDDPMPDPSDAERAWAALLRSDLTTVLVAEAADGGLAASCTLVVVPNLTRDARPYALIENVVTHARHRRRGYGGAVLRRAMAMAWEADCYKIMLASGSRQAATLRFYEAAGFARGTKTFFQARRA